MNRRILTMLPCLIVASMTSTGAVAAGGYLGAAVVNSDVGARESSGKLGLQGAYRFHDRLALELAYLDLGEWNWIEACPGPCIPEDITRFRLDAQRFDLAIAGTLPLTSRLQLYARAGVARLSSRLRGNHMLSGPITDERDTDTVGVAGAGAQFRVWRQVSLNLQWDRLDSKLGELDSLWVGARVSFGR
jgi:hypothetical protein